MLKRACNRLLAFSRRVVRPSRHPGLPSCRLGSAARCAKPRSLRSSKKAPRSPMAKDEDVSVGVSAKGGAHVPHPKYERLIARAKELPPVTTIIAHPCDETSLRGAAEAAESGIIVPILVGPASKIAAAAQTHGIDISRFDIVDAPHSHAAAGK